MSGRTCRPAPSARPGPRTGDPTNPASFPRPHPAAALQPAPALACPHLRPRGRGVCLLAHRPGATPALTSRLWRWVRTLLCPTLANFWEFIGSGPTTLKCFWATALYPCSPTYIACSAASWWPDPLRPPLFPEAHLVPGEEGREHYTPGAEPRIWRSPCPSPVFLKSLELNPFLSKVCCARWAPGEHTPAEGFSRGGMCKLGSTACWLVIRNNLRRWGQR